MTELEAVLASDIFAKAPSQARLLRYICEKYFEGCAAESKEYNIGVEAMGKRPDFDPSMNSVVRVEVHRLRQKLKKYYETDGADHSIVITLPIGRYVPQFIKREPVIAQASVGGTISGNTKGKDARSAELSAGALLQKHSQAKAISRRSLIRPRMFLGIVVGALCLLAAVLIFLKGDWPTPATIIANSKPAGEELISTTAATTQSSVRIIAGYSRNAYVDHSGKVWEGDRYFTGGTTETTPGRFIFRTLDPTLYQSYRAGDFSYNIPLKSGTYELRLYFAELFFGPDSYSGGGEASRIFSVELNGKPLLHDLDVICGAHGDNTAYVRDFKDVSPEPDGYLHCQFVSLRDDPMLSALEVLPGIPGKIHPIRIIAQDSPYTDQEGRIWSADSYFRGGQLAHHKALSTGTEDPDLYSSQRFGDFSYSLPVAPGKYQVTLRFSETYFGPDNPGGGGTGSRIFDVFANNRPILHNFDIYKEAGGENRALDDTFTGLEPNAQGQIVLDFVPSVNYACVSALEVVSQPK